MVSPVIPAIARWSPGSSSRVYDIGLMEGGGGEIVEEEEVVRAGEQEEKVYVAVGKEVKESRSALIWAVQNSGGKRICLLHVLVPSATIPMMGAEVPVSSAKAQVVRAHRESERQNMHKALNLYHRICMKMGVQPEKLFLESDSIENGIMELIQCHGIKNLVVGAASDKRYKRNMTELKSKKAIFLKIHSPASCLINFVCNGHLIHKSRVFPSNAERHAGRTSMSSLPSSPVPVDSCTSESEGVTRRSLSHNSAFSSCSSSSGAPDIPSTPVSRPLGNERRSWSIHEHDNSYLTYTSILDGSMDVSFLDQLEQAISEAETAKREALQEVVKRGKAEKDVIEAVRKVKSLETLYAKEHRKRKDVEGSLAKEEENLESMKNQLAEVKEELQVAVEQKTLLQKKLKETDEIMRELEQKIMSTVGLLQTYKEERDKLQFERDNALREAEELRRNQSDFSGSSLSQYYTEFPYPEIVEATRNFHPSLKIGEGGYGSIFKGSLRQTTVAIKILHEKGLQGPQEFQQEVDVLSKVRHPNLVTLIGACPESWALVYEYLPNGSLEDRLSCLGNTMPLSWQTRIRIATELCSALVFLHSSTPQSIVHGDLKPANVLLDAHLVSKLSDFGICRFISRNVSSSNNTTLLYKTENPRGTLQYMDPEFLSSGELSTKSDVYSFGVILLRLLTGKSALGIIKEAQCAIESGNLKSHLDPLAGDWPYLQAEQLARLALRCCDLNRKNRPDLGSDVWRLLEPMRASCGGFWSFFDERCQPPSHFICPVLQEVMQDPHVAADGFTYEAEALRGWLESGHNTSPMTNDLLPHRSLIPNHALRAAIQEWLQKQ